MAVVDVALVGLSGIAAVVVFLFGFVAGFVDRELAARGLDDAEQSGTRTIRPVTASLSLCRSVSVPAYAESGAVDRLNAGIPAVFMTTSTA